MEPQGNPNAAMSNDEAILQRYVIDDSQISQLEEDGALGTSRENGLHVLIRRIPKGDAQKEDAARRELDILGTAYDSTLPVLAEWLETDSSLWLVIYDRPSCSLREVIEAKGCLTDNVLKSVVTQLFSGLSAIFYAGYAHLRICDQTLYLDEEHNLTIRGLKYAHKYDEEKTEDLYAATEEKYGDDIYVAPEVFASRKYNARKATIWSCGVVLYYMATGQTSHLANLEHPSFEGKAPPVLEEQDPAPPRRFSLSGRKLSVSAAQAKIITYPGTDRFSVPAYARDIISKMLIANPYRRAELIEVAAKVPKEFVAHATRPLMELAWLDYKEHVGPLAGLDTQYGNDSSASSIFSGVSNLSKPLTGLLSGRRRSSVAAGGVESSHRRQSSANKYRFA